MKKRVASEYSAIIGNIISRIRFEKYVLCVNKRHGHIAEMIINELLLHGQTSVKQITDSVIEKLDQDSQIDQSVVTSTQVNDMFRVLVQSKFICRCIAGPQTSAESQSSSQPVSASVATGRKRKRILDEEDECQPESKKTKTDGTPSVTVSDVSSGVWMINYESLDRCILDQVIVDAIARRVGKVAAHIVAIILRLSNSKSPALTPRGNAVSFNEIWHLFAQEQTVSQGVFTQWLKVLTDDASCFICREGDSGGGMYSINFKAGLTELAMAHIESVVNERFGSKARRIFRLLHLKKRLEQKPIEVLSMIHPKEAKELLYRMFEDHYLSLTEVPRGSEYLTSKIIYLFSVDLPQVARMLTDTCYKSLSNLVCRRTHENTENAPLLRQQQVMDVVVARLEEAGTDEEVIESYKQQMTTAQRTQLENFGKIVDKLDRASIQAENTLFLLQTYLTYAYLK